MARGRVFVLPDLAGYAPGWFARGRVRVLSGRAAGLLQASRLFPTRLSREASPGGVLA